MDSSEGINLHNFTGIAPRHWGTKGLHDINASVAPIAWANSRGHSFGAKIVTNNVALSQLMGGPVLKARAEKLLHLAREMRLAFRIAQFAPTDDDARIIIRHLVIRAENFIEHVRAIRRPLRKQGYNTRELKRITTAYADFFDEYLVVTRHKLGAHVQDFDFGQRLELWNSIEASKSEFFAEGAVEIYRCLMSLGLRDFPPYEDFPELGQIDFATSLAAFRASGDKVARVEIAADSLALSRPNTTAMLNGTTVHARAAQVALLHRWIMRGDAFMAHFEAYRNVLRIFKARLVKPSQALPVCKLTI